MRVEDIAKEYYEDRDKALETNWFNALTFEAFKKYNFEWDHRKSQEENSKLFLEAVENYGYDAGRRQALLYGND